MQTDPFQVDSYETAGGEFIPLESASPVIFVTPTSGALSGESLSLSDSTVGAYSQLTVGLTTVHTIPSDGNVEIEFPKWNPFATNAALYESYVATATSPGSVVCNAISNIPMISGTELSCIFTHGTDTDILQVSFEGLLSGSVGSNTAISFSVDGVRGPPTTTEVTGFKFKTTNVDGFLIDESLDSTVISLKVNAGATSLGSNVEVTSNDPSINEISTLTVRIELVNPIEIDSNVQLTIPADFGVGFITSVTTLGSSLYPTPAWTFDEATRLLTVTAINQVYLASRSFIYIVINEVVNPS